MCSNTSCSMKQFCYRYVARANPHRQSVSSFKCGEEGAEDHMVDIRNKGVQWYDGMLEMDLFPQELANHWAELFSTMSNDTARHMMEEDLKRLLQ